MTDFKLQSEFKPTGDQPTAIKQLVEALNNQEESQVLLGVTGSGKTFTAANVIQQTGRPTLILSHNKTLAAQLYGEFKQFFPDNMVEYFVSYYDYYQPEAFLPTTNTYIEKDLSINDEIEKLRLSTLSALLSGRRDVIVVSSVSCIYGIGNPGEYQDSIMKIEVNQQISRQKFLLDLVTILYSRNDVEFKRGTFRVKGDTVDINLAYADHGYRIIFWGDDIESIESIDPVTGQTLNSLEYCVIYPANMFVTSPETLNNSIRQIQLDLGEHLIYLKEIGKHLEAKRLEDRVTYDIEMMKELGYCSGIENYSRYFDNRQPGERPFCLLDYFPKDGLLFIDESHVTVSQIKAMYGGDRSRKQNLVEHGFRLPSAMDNRPLTFEEFESFERQTIYISATPADYELEKTEGVYVEQVIRPTGLLDPIIEVRPTLNQVDDLMEEIRLTIEKKERTLVTTLTKRMAEDLTAYLFNLKIKCRYIHSEVDTLDRVEILRELRLGTIDVLIGVNLLREGLDLPEVSLVAILDADKEGFLRSERSLTQTVGRAARNVNGKAIMYADKITGSMERTISETERRREKQLKYNEENGITPKQITRSKEAIMGQTSVAGEKQYKNYETGEIAVAADPVMEYMTIDQLEKTLTETKHKMEDAAKEMDFLQAAKYRDEMFALEKLVNNKKGN